MKRQTRFRNVAAAVSVAVLTAGVVGCSSGGGGSNRTLQVYMGNHGFTEQVQANIEAFEESTGIDVEISVYGEEQLSDQYTVQLNAGSDDIDVMMFRPLQEARLYWENGWLEDLEPHASTATDWDLSDFQPGPIDALTFDGALTSIPVSTERAVLYYRADLLAEQGIAVPTTFEELADAAAAIEAAHDDVVGYVARGNAHGAVPIFSAFLYSHGGDWVDAEGNAALDTPEAIAAYETYGGLLRDYGPSSGLADIQWDSAMALFTQGKAAFYIDADSLATNAIDPSSSTIVDSVAFAPLPAGPAGSRTFNIPNYALGISAYSSAKDEAWAFIEYFTSKESTKQFQLNAIPGARVSVWLDDEALAGFPPTLAAAIAESLDGVGRDRPAVARASEAREIVGRPLLTVLEAGDTAAAAQEANRAFQQLLDEVQD